jgi:hypothetical protein
MSRGWPSTDGVLFTGSPGDDARSPDERRGLAFVLVITFALGAGWQVGGPARATRLTTSVVTGYRANGAAPAVATSAFADQPEVAAGVITAGLISVTVPTTTSYLIAWRAPKTTPEAMTVS